MGGVLTYTGAGGVFTRRGKISKSFNDVEKMQTSITDNLISLREGVRAQFTLQDDAEYLAQIVDSFEEALENLNSSKGDLVDLFENTFNEIGDLLSAPANERDFQQLINLLIQEMIEDSQTVLENTFSIAHVAIPGIVGNGQIKYSLLDDKDEVAELVFPEKIRLRCISDFSANDTDRGKEVFQISGEPIIDPEDYQDKGSGVGESFTTFFDDNNFLPNGDFEEWDDPNSPTDWTTGSGNVHEETVEKYTGSKSMRIDGGTAIVQVKRALLDSSDRPVSQSRLFFIIYIKTALITTGDIQVYLQGTNFNPPTANQITISGGYPAVWTPYFFEISTGDFIPDDLELIIEVNNIDAAGKVYFDNSVLATPILHRGVWLAIFRGNLDFRLDEYFDITITKLTTGLWQEFFGRNFNRYLPSSGAPTIPDSLMT